MSPLEAAVALVVALIGFAGIVWQNKRAEDRIRAENTEQHADGRLALDMALEAAKAHTDATVKPVAEQVDRVEGKVDKLSTVLTGRVFPMERSK